MPVRSRRASPPSDTFHDGEVADGAPVASEDSASSVAALGVVLPVWVGSSSVPCSEPLCSATEGPASACPASAPVVGVSAGAPESTGDSPADASASAVGCSSDADPAAASGAISAGGAVVESVTASGSGAGASGSGAGGGSGSASDGAESTEWLSPGERASAIRPLLSWPNPRTWPISWRTTVIRLISDQPQPAASTSTTIERPEDSPRVAPGRSSIEVEIPETSPPTAAHSDFAWDTASASPSPDRDPSAPTGSAGRELAVIASGESPAAASGGAGWPPEGVPLTAGEAGAGTGLVVTVAPPSPEIVPWPPPSMGHEMEAGLPSLPPTVVHVLVDRALARASRAFWSWASALAWASCAARCLSSAALARASCAARCLSRVA